MGEGEKIDIGSIAVAHGLVTPEALKECREELRIMRGRGAKTGLAELFLEKRLLSRDEIAGLEKLRAALGNRLGPFELLARLGEGGMGTVYKVRDTRTNEPAALKIIPASVARDGEFMARFERETRAWKAFSHPNIVKTLDVGTLDYGRKRLHYISTELIEGETLSERIEESGPVEEKLALDWLADIARALQCAHHEGLVHRGVKPENIFIVEDERAKLGDFGLALDLAREARRIKRTGTCPGSVHYASPEQARGDEDIDIRSDIYSLGASFYHALTGEVPFEGESAASVLAMHLTAELPWPGDVNPRVSDGASELVAKMTAKEKEERFQDPVELLRALDEVRSETDVRPFLRSAALSSIARSTESRQRALQLTRRRRDRLRRRIERRLRKHPHLYVAAAGAGAGALVFLSVLVAVFARGEKNEAEPPRAVVEPLREEPPGPEPPPPPVRPRRLAPPELEIPPGAWVLYRETFDEGGSEWRAPPNSGPGEEPLPTALGAPGRALRLASLSDNAFYGSGAARKVRLSARRTGVLAFRHRTERNLSQLVPQLVLKARGGRPARFFARPKPSPVWKAESIRLDEFLSEEGRPVPGDPVEIEEIRFFAGLPGDGGVSYVDDVVIYEPEERGHELVLSESRAPSWRNVGKVSIRGEEAVLSGDSEARLARSFVDFKVSFLAERRSREGEGGWWCCVSLEGGGDGLRVVLRDDGAVHVLQGETVVSALEAGTVRPEEARLEFCLQGELMTIRTPAGQYRRVRLGSFRGRGLGFRSAPGAIAALSQVRVKELDPFERYRAEPDKAIAACVAEAGLKKERRPEMMYSIGKTFLHGLRRPHEALVAFDTCIVMGPSPALLTRARYEKARALSRVGRTEESNRLLTELINAPAVDDETRRSATTLLKRLLKPPPPPPRGVSLLPQEERPRQKPVIDFAGACRVVRGVVRADDPKWKNYATSVQSGRTVSVAVESTGAPFFTAKKECVFDAAVWTRNLWSLRLRFLGSGGAGKLSGYMPRPGSRWRILHFDSAVLSGEKPLAVERIEFIGEVEPGGEAEIRVARVWALVPEKDPRLAFLARLMARLWPLLEKHDYGLARVMVENAEPKDPGGREIVATVKLVVGLASRLYRRARANCAARARGETMTLGGTTGEVTEADFSGLTIKGDRLEISRMTAGEVIGLFQLGPGMTDEEAAAARAAFYGCERETELARREAIKSGKWRRQLEGLLRLLAPLTRGK